MAIYNFLRWEINGVPSGTTTTLQVTVNGDATITAVYSKDQHTLTFQTTPIAVSGATVNGQAIASGGTVIVDHGAVATFVVPQSVTV